MTVLGNHDEPINLPEPFGSLVAFLSDLHEQIELQQRTITNQLSWQMLEELKVKLEVMAALVVVVAKTD